MNYSKTKSLTNDNEDNHLSNQNDNLSISKNAYQVDKNYEKSAVNNQNKFQQNSQVTNNFNNGTNDSVKNNEINFKDSYVFMIGSIDFKFSFIDKNAQVFLSFYKCSSDNDSEKLKSTLIPLREFKDFNIVVKDGKSYHHRIIRLRYLDANRTPLEIISHVKNDYDKFVNKLEKYLKKGTV